MDAIAERGVAAHWVYKTDASPANSAQSRAREWVSGLVDRETQTPSSLEFIENVKIDLFPDEVYLFTPKGGIIALPRNATALDFAYFVHTDVGNHAVAARVDKKARAAAHAADQRAERRDHHAPSAAPSPQWLEWVVSGRARTAIRQHLKHLQHEDAVDFGHRMLDRALDALGSSLEAIPHAVLDRYLADNKFKRLEELLADIALGNRMPDAVARALRPAARRARGQARAHRRENPDHRRERGVLTFGNCCHPVPGDEIMGYLSAGKGIVVHRVECPNVPELRKSPERVVDIGWDANVRGDYKVELRIEVANKPGVLAQVAAAIADAGSNIENVEYKERDGVSATLLFTIEVKNRKHLADVMRRVRRLGGRNGGAAASRLNFRVRVQCET